MNRSYKNLQDSTLKRNLLKKYTEDLNILMYIPKMSVCSQI